MGEGLRAPIIQSCCCIIIIIIVNIVIIVIITTITITIIITQIAIPKKQQQQIYFSNASPSLGVLVIDLKKLDVEKYFVQTPPILTDPGRCSHGSKSQSATVWNPFHQRYNLEFGKISKWNTENPVAIYLYLFQDCCLQDIKWQIKARKHPCGANINSNLSFH